MTVICPTGKNPQVLSRRREPAHASLIPYQDADTALAGERGSSKYFKLLNGAWQFFYASSIKELPAQFEPAGFVPDHWDKITGPKATGKCLDMAGRSTQPGVSVPGDHHMYRK